MEPLKIKELFAFIATDEAGNEGVCGFHSDSGWIPMVGADQAMIDKLKPIAKRLAQTTGQPLEVCRFSTRESIETIGYKH